MMPTWKENEPGEEVENWGMRHWAFEEMQDFLMEHGLVEAGGKSGDDSVTITGKGSELAFGLNVLVALNRPAQDLQVVELLGRMDKLFQEGEE